jgi:hypothetical protein
MEFCSRLEERKKATAKRRRMKVFGEFFLSPQVTKSLTNEMVLPTHGHWIKRQSL